MAYRTSYNGGGASLANGTAVNQNLVWNGSAWVASTYFALSYSLVDYMTHLAVFVINAGNFTTGALFNVTRDAKITGVYFYWAGAVARTLRCKLWDSDGVTVLATVDVAVNGAGYYTGTFGAPVVVSTALSTKWYAATVWETSGAEYTRYNAFAGVGVIPVFPFFDSALLWHNWNGFGAGDLYPTGSGVEFFPVQPILVAN
jgi:Domain of unknown function (DUF4082)